MRSFLGILLLCCVWQGSHGTGKNEFGLAVQTEKIVRSLFIITISRSLSLDLVRGVYG